jgi:hypothetical protein
MAELMLLSVSRKTSLPQILSMMSSRETSCPWRSISREDLHGYPLQLERAAGTAQFVGDAVNFQIVTEFNYVCGHVADLCFGDTF